MAKSRKKSSPPIHRALVSVHQDLGFGSMLITSKNSLISSLNTRIKALKKISSISSFKTRLCVCSSIVVSKILHRLPLYGGGPDYMVAALQKKLT